jgi:gamma-resorcylate decarboxylase
VEAERCVKKLGSVGVMVGRYTNNGLVNDVIYLDHPINEPFWEKMAELDVPLYLHSRMTPPNQQHVYQGYDFLAGSPWGFSTETAAHALRLMVSGLFDRHPNLQIILGHCGEGLPFSLARVDQRMRHFQKSFWPANQTMTYYYKTNFWVTTSGVQDDGALFDTLRVTGADRVIFSVDYPYEYYVEIGSWFDRVEQSDATKGKVASGNAKRLLKLGT